MVNRIELLFAKRHLISLSIGTKIEMSRLGTGYEPFLNRKVGIAKEGLEYVIAHSDKKGTKSLEIK